MKSNVIVSVFGALVIFLGFAGCEMGNGNTISEERSVAGFNSIILDGVGDVNVYPGKNNKVVVTTDSNLQDRVLTTVNGNTLRIDQSPGTFNAKELIIDVYVPELASISLNGAGSITVDNGNASELVFSLTGTGDINAQNFQVKNANITHSGVGDARIWVTDSLNGTHSGVGNIQYKGNPEKNVKRSGVGSISPM